jgi:hypothetical protein
LVWPSIATGYAAAFAVAEHRAIARRCHPTATDDISRIPHVLPAILALGYAGTTAFAIHIHRHILWRTCHALQT